MSEHFVTGYRYAEQTLRLPDLHQACCAVNHNFVHRRAAVAEPASLDWEER